MSIIETILTRAMNEPEFADQLFADAEKALAEYNLPAEEIEKFKAMSRIDLNTLTSVSPEERKSMSVFLTRNKKGDGS